MKKKISLIILIVLSSGQLLSQDLVHSLYGFTQNRVNPAMASTDNYQRANFLFRKQYASQDISFFSSYAEIKHPFFNRERRWSGLSLSLLNDKSQKDGVYSFNQVSLSYAINIPLNASSEISLGLNTAFQNKALNTAGFTTGSQYVEYFGFDPSLPDGEGGFQENLQYFTYSAGLYWQKLDRFGKTAFSAGYALYNLNRPAASFYFKEQEKLPLHSILTASLKLHQTYLWGIRQDILFHHSGASTELVLGPALKYALDNMGRQTLDVMLRYSTANNIMLGAVYDSENFSLGGSYDFNILKNQVSNTGTFEVVLSVKRLRKPKNKGRKKSKTNNERRQQPPETNPTFEDDGKDIASQQKTDEPVEEKELIIAKTEAGEITYQPHELENLKHTFYFDFNEAQLNAEDKAYIEDMTAILKQNERVKVLISGHTDALGTDEYNKQLSFERAKKIGLILLRNGVPKKRIKLETKGESEPVESNETEEGRAKNRRVIMSLIYE